METKIKKEAISYFVIAVIVGILEIALYYVLHRYYSIEYSNMLAYAFGVISMFVLLKVFVYNDGLSQNMAKKSLMQMILTIIMHFVVFNSQCYLLEMFEALLKDADFVVIQEKSAMISKFMVNVVLYPFVWMGNRFILKGSGVLVCVNAAFLLLKIFKCLYAFIKLIKMQNINIEKW